MLTFVTDGAGFLGSHLCDRLLADENTVVALDNFVTGSRGNLHDALSTGRCTLVETDASEPLFSANFRRLYVDPISSCTLHHPQVPSITGAIPWQRYA